MPRSKTRAEYHLEEYRRRNGDDAPDYWVDEVNRWVRREDERMWAFSRDPETSFTQREARELAQVSDYPKAYNISQSSISRKLSTLDDKILYEPIRTLRVEDREPLDSHERVGLLAAEEIDDLEMARCGDLLEGYRRALARFLVDLEALDEFTHGERITPQWARDRFRWLDPDTGRKYHKRTPVLEDDNLHPPVGTEEADALLSRSD